MSKIAVVTGATSGIGRSLVLTLLKDDMTVIGVGRSDDKINQLINDAKDYYDDKKLFIVKGDLSYHKALEDLSQSIIDILVENELKIDYLCHVAGRVTSGYHISQDHHELTFQVNHLAVVDLTYFLLPYMVKSLESRILVVSSQSHFRANINFNDLETKTYYTILRSYKRSKLYNVLFVKAFSKKYKDIPIYAIDPALVRTNIGMKNTSKLASFVWHMRSKKGVHPAVPAKHMLDVIKDQSFNDLSGSYIKHGKPITSNPLTYQDDVVERFWKVSLDMLEITDYFHKKS